MNKNDLIEQVAKVTKLSKSDVTRAVGSTFDCIAKALKKGDTCTFVGFGTFSTSKRKAREGRNPRTGAKIRIPASVQPKFRAGKALKEAVNG
ncbi:HU family DNA-binding protein [Candidatus Nucleicultrix amoebiphila]|jgi:DNA-binding protein HU-beta|uniref:Transcriptional regulator HU subunit alpha n=1 Tax=Candidatus Nucleicultrix amoebiphila FS5 TaxID=1414854 RepID=A0A1W6N607_9PROT|nr:HU family DNA-binding protein [Candidatus Nucleicultrix amoebiphila]ARN85271.1 transcriptional regulator HU subunit alpha [Candidatus Nucleicultrix amoebiphila FS5]